jgi:hypothetical protein
MELSVIKNYEYSIKLFILVFLTFCSYAPAVFFPKYPLIAPIFSSAILIFYRQFFYKNTGKEFSSVLRYLLAGEGGGFIGIIGFLSELVLLNLLAQYIGNIIANADVIKNISLAIVTILNMFSVGFAFVYYFDKQLSNVPTGVRSPRSVLIFALSKPGEKKDQEKYKNIREKYKNIRENFPINYEPIYDLLEFHKDVLKEIHVLYSPEAEGGFKHLDNILNHLSVYEKLKYEKYKCDFNNENAIKDKIAEISKHIKNHEDKDISIYISAGTSLITAFLTMLGLEKDRQIEYLDQSNSTIKSIEISKEDALLFIKSLALE